MALGRLGTRCHPIICSRAKEEGRRWLGDMRGNSVGELLLELNKVAHGVLGRVGAALSGLEDGVGVLSLVVVVVVESRKMICGPPELPLRRHRLVHAHVPRMARQLYAQRHIEPRRAWGHGEGSGLGVSTVYGWSGGGGSSAPFAPNLSRL